MNPVINKIKNC